MTTNPEQPTIDLRFKVTPAMFAWLQEEMERQELSLEELLREAIETYAQLPAFEDTPKEEILEGFREAWHEAMTGQTVDAREALRAMRLERANRLMLLEEEMVDEEG